MGLVAKRIEHVPHSDPPKVVFKSLNHGYDSYERLAEEIRVVLVSRKAVGLVGPETPHPRTVGADLVILEALGGFRRYGQRSDLLTSHSDGTGQTDRSKEDVP